MKSGKKEHEEKEQQQQQQHQQQKPIQKQDYILYIEQANVIVKSNFKNYTIIQFILNIIWEATLCIEKI